jgi:hypothetical protein
MSSLAQGKLAQHRRDDVLYNDKTKTRVLRLSAEAADDAHQYWTDLLGDAGFRNPTSTGWKDYWAFWCDKVQPGRKKTGQRLFGIGQPMGVDSSDSFSSSLSWTLTTSSSSTMAASCWSTIPK